MFYKCITNLFGVLVKVVFRVKVVGIDNIPQEGSCIIACNHKSNWDGIIIAGLLKKRKINVLAKKELFKNKILKSFLTKLNVIPVDRENPDLSTVKTVLKLLKNNEVIGIFPEGTRNKGEDAFSQAKAGLGMFAIKGKTTVVPVSLISKYKIFGRVTVYIDKPVDLSEYYGKKMNSQDYQVISDDIMDIIKKNYFENKNK